MHLAYLGLGNQPWVLRLPALLGGVLLVPATYALARLLFSPRAAVLSASFVAVSSYLVEYSTNARGYTLQALAFVVLGSAILGVLGLIAGIWADKFDQLAAFQNFIIMPLTFLSGVFYSIHSLPPFWQVVSHFNPFFYMIDGFRYGFFGLSDVSPLVSLAVVAACAGLLAAIAISLLSRGWKLRH